MGNAQKRKTSPTGESESGNAKRRFIESEPAIEEAHARNEDNASDAEPLAQEPERAVAEPSTSDPPGAQEVTADNLTAKARDRMARFQVLREKQAQGRKNNRKETQLEAQRIGQDPNLMASLQRKSDVAAQKLLKAETEDAGEDFERKRAWDWTIEESEAWDRRLAKKEKHRQDVGTQDYSVQARKVYKRQLEHIKPDLDAYERQKMEAIEEAARNGGLDIVETETGELIAVDKDGSFYSTADGTGFVNNKPSKERVDQLVAELQRAEEVRLRKRRERARRNGEDVGDVSYINLKNKQFNEKLMRFYDKYTSDIKESIERGTAI